MIKIRYPDLTEVMEDQPNQGDHMKKATEFKVVEINGQKVVVEVHPEVRKRDKLKMKIRGKQTQDLDWQFKKLKV